MRILSCNPGHDGAIAYLVDGRLVRSTEVEKDSHPRYEPLAAQDVSAAFGELGDAPDIFCVGGFWHDESTLADTFPHVGYHGLARSTIAVAERDVLGRTMPYFSSSHERSHLLCAFGMSDLPKGTPCYALVWEGIIGSFYEIDRDLNITRLAEVMTEPGNRYSALYGLADPTFPKDADMARAADAGKLMALASFSPRSALSPAEEALLAFILTTPEVRLDRYDGLADAPHYDAGIDSAAFRNFAGVASDRIFDAFHRYAKDNMRKGLPLLIAGGCGLNCDWNSKWEDSGLFSEVFVPPVANDSGSAIGTAIDAQFHFAGNPKIEWNVYSGLPFRIDMPFEHDRYDIVEADHARVADLLAEGLILGWVNGRYEIGPRALGNRSILAAPFEAETRVRLNTIKQREQFRPIAPVCLEEDAARWFGCDHASPHMLYTYQATTDALAAVTHVNGTARIQTVNSRTNAAMFDLLTAFKARTGYGVLCNTSLNFVGKGFINNLADLDTYASRRKLDGFVVDGRAYLLRSSDY